MTTTSRAVCPNRISMMTFVVGHKTAAKWTAEQDDELRRYRSEGYSYSQIAFALDAGYSRNAVIGRLHRLGLTDPKAIRRTGTRPSNPTPRVKRARSTKFRPDDVRILQSPEYPNLRCVEVTPRNIGLLDLEPNDCRYPYGDGPYTFCGHPKIEGSSYCGAHYALTLGAARFRKANHIGIAALEGVDDPA